MTYTAYKSGYAIWNNEIMIPYRTKNGKKSYFKKEIPLEESPHYWEYIREDDVWNVYYVTRDKDRRLASYNIGEWRPEAIIARIHDRDISISDCRRIEEHRSHIRERISVTNNWSVQYDGRSILELLKEKPNCTYEHALLVISNEGGYVDDKAIVRKGTAENKIVKID